MGYGLWVMGYELVKRKVEFPFPLMTVILAVDLGGSEWFAS